MLSGDKSLKLQILKIEHRGTGLIISAEQGSCFCEMFTTNIVKDTYAHVLISVPVSHNHQN